jgi:hypothetical protein
MLSLAVVNEVLDRRRRQRWSILAQYVMFELVRNARMIWLGMLDVAGLQQTGDSRKASIDRSAEVVRDTPRLTAAMRAVVATDDGVAHLRQEVAFLAEHGDEVLGRWAGVMLNSAMYAEVIDRHVELAGDLAWVAGILDMSQPPEDDRRQKRARGNPSIQFGMEHGIEWLADRIVVIAQLAESLDRGTMDLGLRIVPVQWWMDRLRPDPGT